MGACQCRKEIQAPTDYSFFMSKKSAAHLKHAEAVLRSVQNRMQQPHKLSRFEAQGILDNLHEGESDVFLSLTPWKFLEFSISLGDVQTIEELDTRFEYGKNIRSSVLVTSERIFFMAESHFRVVEASEFTGWDLQSDDSLRMSSIKLAMNDRSIVTFKVRKTLLSEFRQALFVIDKPELDPPTNPEYFRSYFMNTKVDDSEFKHLEELDSPETLESFSFMSVEPTVHPRHIP